MATVIRKYGNRRLYDTSARRYVNLDEIAQMIRAGDDVQVVDAKTGEDLTRGVLTQIIVDETRSHDRGLPLEILRELIALSGRAKNELFLWYLRTAFDTYRKAQQVPVDFVRGLFAPKQSESDKVEELRKRVAELERMLERGNAPRR